MLYQSVENQRESTGVKEEQRMSEEAIERTFAQSLRQRKDMDWRTMHFHEQGQVGKINDDRGLDGRWFATTAKHSTRQRMEV